MHRIPSSTNKEDKIELKEIPTCKIVFGQEDSLQNLKMVTKLNSESTYISGIMLCCHLILLLTNSCKYQWMDLLQALF